MSYPHQIYLPASSEFIALCQSQVSLLTQGLGATWSAVYLTERLAEGTETKLIPVLVYPSQSTIWQRARSLTRLPTMYGRSPRLLAASPEVAPVATVTQEWQEQYTDGQQQIVLPLIHEEMVVGLLVTARSDREWNEGETAHIEKIARTLAIACLLDRERTWYQQQFESSQKMRSLERNRLDDLLHQLRNPLTTLRTFGKLLLKRLLPGDRNQKVAQGILQESERLQELLAQFEESLPKESPILNAAPNNNSGQFLLPGNSLSLEPVAIREVLDPFLPGAEEIAKDRGIDFLVQIDGNLPKVKANGKALREVLSNLIDNALKYTDYGGIVEIEARDELSNWQSIVIRDTGYGIPLADQPRIFHRHYRGIQASGNISGSGLGLAIVQEIIQAHGGSITAQNHPETGGAWLQIILPQSSVQV